MVAPGRLGLLGMPCLCLLAPNGSKLCASSPMLQRASPVPLWRHLARHCKNVTITDLPTQHGDVSRTLHGHAIRMRANLLVMGAYAHPKLLQMVLGGVTSGMIS